MGIDRESLSHLDETLIAVRLMLARPAFGQQLLDGLDFQGGIAGLRVLRVTERLTASGSAPSIGDVADELAVKHSTASRSVDAVVKANLLRKTACDGDQRRARLVITDQGREVLATVTTRRVDRIERATSTWTSEEAHTLTELLNRLVIDFQAEDRD